jgi:hypothetical protein
MNMKRHIRLAFAVAIILALSGLDAVVVSAQPIAWNPPCGTVTVVNESDYMVTLNLKTRPAGGIVPITLNACTAVTVPSPQNPLAITGVTTQAGTSVPMTTPGGIIGPWLSHCALPSSMLAADGMIKGVALGPTGHCFDLYFYSTGDPSFPCTIFVIPANPPCIP